MLLDSVKIKIQAVIVKTPTNASQCFAMSTLILAKDRKPTQTATAIRTATLNYTAK
jgi:hypothetical protein